MAVKVLKELTDERVPVQLSLFDLEPEKSEKQNRLDLALDSIRSRYGKDAVIRGGTYKASKPSRP